MYVYDRQLSDARDKEQSITLWPSGRYELGNPSPAATFSPQFAITKPIFWSIPVILETLRPPKNQGGDFTLDTEKPFIDIATLKTLVGKTTFGTPPEAAEFSIGQVLMDLNIFMPDPRNKNNFQIPLVHSIAFPADPGDPDKLARSNAPFPVVVITHGQHPNYAFRLRTDSTGKVIKTKTSSALPRVEAATLVDELGSYLGFKYLQLELAKHGIVSISINNNPANIFEKRSLLKLRADLILAHLAHLESRNKDPKSFLFQGLDLKRVGLLGHSIGGDAVVKAFDDNKGRFGIKAIVSLAPLDQTGTLEPGKRLRLNAWDLHYLVVYGSHDGDAGSPCSSFLGTGFRHYDRATCARSMLFIHGATHNRFNTAWNDEGRVKNEIAKSKSGIGRILTQDEHKKLAEEYIGGWFRMVLNREAGLADLFDGTRAVSVARGPLKVSTQWSFGQRVTVIDDFEGPKASENRLKGKSTSRPAKAVIETSIGRVGSAFPHQTKVLLAGIISSGSSTYRTEIPNTHLYPGGPRNRNFNLYDFLTFRMTKMFNPGVSQSDIDIQPLPQFKVRLEDVRLGRATVDHMQIYAANPHAPTRPYHRIDWGDPCIPGGPSQAARVITLNPLETLRAPLALFSKANPKLDLSNIRFLEFEFTSVQKDQIFIDDLQLIKK